MLKGGVGLRIVETETGALIVNGVSLSSKQTEIVKYDGNIIVSASAGTGKTRTMVSKIVYDLECNKSHKVIAAITFTIKATQEIRERLIIDATHNFIGTNNVFAIDEVIKPFMKDVYGDDYDIDFDTDYNNKDYLFDTFDEGKNLMQSNGTIYSYCNRRNCDIHNKNCAATNRNFVFELALDIAKKSKACQMYLNAKYFGIYIDEYQDCDVEMHNFFMFLCEKLKISTFIVGDDKQSIYRWRGARPAQFVSVTKNSNFQHFELTENHRSSLGIQNYSNLLFNHTSNLYQQTQKNGDILVIRKDVDDWASTVIGLLDSTSSTAILRNYKDTCYYGKSNAKDDAQTLTRSGLEFIYIPEAPIELITTSTAWLYMAVARYIMFDDFTVYDFIHEVPTEGEVEKKAVNSVKKHLVKVETNKEIKEEFDKAMQALLLFFNYTTVDQSHIDKLFETINDSQYIPSLSYDLPLHCSMNYHRSKGLEFEQVILFFEDFASFKKVGESDINNHYVACTRAKSKLIIVSTFHDDAFAFKSKLQELFSGRKFTELVTIVPNESD